MSVPLLEVQGLVKHYVARRRWLQKPRPPVRAVDGVSFALGRGETLALVGESDCGKTTTAKAVLRLVEPTAGSVRFEGDELVGLDARRMRERRRDMQLIFQDPYASLNPRLAAHEIVGEPLRNYAAEGTGAARGAAGRRERAAWLFEKVGLRPEALSVYEQLSAATPGDERLAARVVHPQDRAAPRRAGRGPRRNDVGADLAREEPAAEDPRRDAAR